MFYSQSSSNVFTNRLFQGSFWQPCRNKKENFYGCVPVDLKYFRDTLMSLNVLYVFKINNLSAVLPFGCVWAQWRGVHVYESLHVKSSLWLVKFTCQKFTVIGPLVSPAPNDALKGNSWCDWLKLWEWVSAEKHDTAECIASECFNWLIQNQHWQCVNPSRFTRQTEKSINWVCVVSCARISLTLISSLDVFIWSILWCLWGMHAVDLEWNGYRIFISRCWVSWPAAKWWDKDKDLIKKCL